MKFDKTIQIDAIIPQIADNKAKALQKIADTLDQDNLKFFAELCEQKGSRLNDSIRQNQIIIKTSL